MELTWNPQQDSLHGTTLWAGLSEVKANYRSCQLPQPAKPSQPAVAYETVIPNPKLELLDYMSLRLALCERGS